MKIEVIIDDSLFEKPVREATGRVVAAIVDSAVRDKLNKITNEIEAAVEVYLEKRLTSEKLKDMIDSELKRAVAVRIDNIEDQD